MTSKLVVNEEKLVEKTIENGQKYVSYNDFDIQLLKDSPDFALECLKYELKEYVATKNPKYLKKELKQEINAFGYCELSKMTGVAKRTIYRVAESKNKPNFTDIMEFINALGYEFRLYRKFGLRKMA